jgi:hypothetical protein
MVTKLSPAPSNSARLARALPSALTLIKLLVVLAIYALNMAPNKIFSAPQGFKACPHDLAFLAKGCASQQNP